MVGQGAMRAFQIASHTFAVSAGASAQPPAEPGRLPASPYWPNVPAMVGTGSDPSGVPSLPVASIIATVM